MSSSSGTFDLNGWPVWFERFGTGDDIVLLIPGAMGTGRSDFKEQLEGANALSFERYTFVAIELPGWGRSRPPKRPYGTDDSTVVYENDVDCALKLMDNLGYKNYSVIGWSDGAKVAVMMCAQNPQIKCCVAIGVYIWATKENIALILFTQNTKKWPKRKFNSLLDVYGDEDTIQVLWDQHINFCRDAINNCGQQGMYLITPEQLAQIKIPVLLIHGDKDPLIELEQAIKCKDHIPGSVLHRFPEGGHNCHQVFTAEFKKVVENFFENCEKSSQL